MKRRGYQGVTPESSHHITNWLVKCASGEKFQLAEKSGLHPEIIKNGVIALFERGVAPKQDIIMFLGKWEVVVYDRKMGDYSGFNSTETIDWALNLMQGSNS